MGDMEYRIWDMGYGIWNMEKVIYYWGQMGKIQSHYTISIFPCRTHKGQKGNLQPHDTVYDTIS